MTGEDAGPPCTLDYIERVEGSEAYVLLTTLLHRMLGERNAAQSIALNSYLEVQRLVNPLSSPSARALLFDTATRHAICRIRRDRALVAGDVSDIVGNISSPELPVDAKHLSVFEKVKHQLPDAVLQLPEPTRHIFTLRYAQRVTTSEIAKRLKVGVDDIQRELTRALVLCRSALEKRGVTDVDLP